ncbi:PadR family transcriptional regulator [Anaeromicropila herbilytica]|uniref:Transcriptional regulator n=1 Tax=Anaeromicropila herbilytica TaxID=2785025 RepID=A0A7R7ICR0_9FIRM|nr:PadR family transcriptional regulator [Anaeromicropila herbilytica]BCN30787.1 transcriptional regulator [Anaeromicropila herbilytica]
MNKKIQKIYIPMTETGFYILFCLQEEMHAYNITERVKEMTNDEIVISAGTMYTNLSKMEKDGLIQYTKETNSRKLYIITNLGQNILDIELKRIERLYKNSKGELYNGN